MISNNNPHPIQILKERASQDSRFASISIFATHSMATVMYSLDSQHPNYGDFCQDPSVLVDLIEEVRAVLPFNKYCLTIDERSGLENSPPVKLQDANAMLDLESFYTYMKFRIEENKNGKRPIQIIRVHQRFHFPISSDTFVELGFFKDSQDISIRGTMGSTLFAYEYQIRTPQRIKINLWSNPDASDSDKNLFHQRGIDFYNTEDRMLQLRDALWPVQPGEEEGGTEYILV